MPHRLLALLVLSSLLAATLLAARPTVAAADPVLIGAGDIADCDPEGAAQTAALLDQIAGTVITTGDNAYPDGSAANYRDCYAPTWGRHRDRTRPTPGNHEYHSSGAAPYFAYFGANAGPAGRGYYSYDLGMWHIVSLNSNIAAGTDSAQAQWLRDDLATHPTACTLAYWHHPVRSSGSHHGNDAHMAAIWDILAAAKAEVILNGHEHNYERFDPQTSSGRADLNGPREFVIGMGGANHYAFGATQPNSAARNADTFGVLTLTLHPTSYDWAFVPVGGGSYHDAGHADCVGGTATQPTAAATRTSVPPTATVASTSVPPTATATRTSVPPTATVVASPQPTIAPPPTTPPNPRPTRTPAPTPDNQRWHAPGAHEHGDDCAQPLPGNPFTALGNPSLDVLQAGEPHEGFKQFLLYERAADGQPRPGTFACIVVHLGPLTSAARANDRHQVHIVMQDGNGHLTDAAWMIQTHGAGPSECDTVGCGGRWRDGSHNKDLAMEGEVSAQRTRERWWFDTQDDAGKDENGLIDLYTSVQVEDAASYVQRGELPSDLSQLASTLFDAGAPLHLTCAKLGTSGFCPLNDSRRSTGTWHIRIKKTGTFFTDMNGQLVAPTTPGAMRQVLYATKRDYTGHPAIEYDPNRTVVWPN